MSHDEVLASEETKPCIAMPGVISYRIHFGDLPMMLIYRFVQVEDEVVCAAAAMQSDSNFYTRVPGQAKPSARVPDAKEHYQHLKAVLTQELGEPLEEDVAYSDEELITGLKDAASEPDEPDDLAMREAMRDLIAELRGQSHSEDQMRSLMTYTRWQSENTDSNIRLEPGPLGATILMICHSSRQHARFFPGHPDYRPPDK